MTKINTHKWKKNVNYNFDLFLIEHMIIFIDCFLLCTLFKIVNIRNFLLILNILFLINWILYALNLIIIVNYHWMLLKIKDNDCFGFLRMIKMYGCDRYGLGCYLEGLFIRQLKLTKDRIVLVNIILDNIALQYNNKILFS